MEVTERLELSLEDQTEARNIASPKEMLKHGQQLQLRILQRKETVAGYPKPPKCH
jgi:hypothetical protein